MYSNEKALETYRKVIEVCQSPGFFLCLNRKIYKKADLSYEFVVDNASHIAYIETEDIDMSRIYMSTFVMLLTILSMDRRHTGRGIEFVGLKESVVLFIHRIQLWNINSGYNTAMNDVKGLIGTLEKNSETLDGNV